MFQPISGSSPVNRMIRLAAAVIIGCLPWQAATAGEAGPDQTSIAPFVVANTEFTLVHELVHVLIDEIGFPVMGREEDLADYLATTQLLATDQDELDADTVDRLQAVIDAWRVEWTIVEQDNMEIAYSDPHALEIQRLYDMVCLTYGRQPQMLDDFRIANELSRDRADLCAADYSKAANGLDFLERAFATKNPGSQLTLTFEAGESPSHRQYQNWLEHNSMVSELIHTIDETYAFPRPVTIRFRSCGQANAYWEPKIAEVVMCYGLMDRFVHLARFRQEYAVERRNTTLGMYKAKNAFN